MGPAWFVEAGSIMDSAAAARGRRFTHYLQTNLISYSPAWNEVIFDMFGGSLGTSMDFPNLHRKLFNGGAEAYTKLWTTTAPRSAQAAGHSRSASSPSSTRAASMPAPMPSTATSPRNSELTISRSTPRSPAARRSRSRTNSISTSRARRIPRRALRHLDGARASKRGRPRTLRRAHPPLHRRRPRACPASGRRTAPTSSSPSIPRAPSPSAIAGSPATRSHFFGNVFKEPDLTHMLSESPARREFVERPKLVSNTRTVSSAASSPSATAAARCAPTAPSAPCFPRIPTAKSTRPSSPVPKPREQKCAARPPRPPLPPSAPRPEFHQFGALDTRPLPFLVTLLNRCYGRQ